MDKGGMGDFVFLIGIMIIYHCKKFIFLAIVVASGNDVFWKEKRHLMAKKTLPAIKKTEISTNDYAKFISSLKAKIRSSQIKAAVAVNRELIKLYWEIGEEIVEKQENEGWGTKVLERVARDLQNEFPGWKDSPEQTFLG